MSDTHVLTHSGWKPSVQASEGFTTPRADASRREAFSASLTGLTRWSMKVIRGQSFCAADPNGRWVDIDDLRAWLERIAELEAQLRDHAHLLQQIKEAMTPEEWFDWQYTHELPERWRQRRQAENGVTVAPPP